MTFAVLLAVPSCVAKLAAWVSLALFLIPFLCSLVRFRTRRAMVGALAVALLLSVLVGTAAAVPVRDPCVSCREWAPSWVCTAMGCW